MRSHRSLRTILFTDLVGSTERAAEMGDAAWRELLQRHHAVVRQALRRWGAREVNETGDGFLAILDSPARGIACAAAIRDAVRALGLEVRCGVHMGEVEHAADGSVGGIGVHIGARVMAKAQPREILVSRAVRDAEEGSGFAFQERGAFELKGISGERHLYVVTALPQHAASLAPGRGERAVAALRRRPGTIMGVAAVVVVLGIVLTARGGQNSGRDEDSVPVDGAGATTTDLDPGIDRSIAVLPFDNLSEDPADAFFAEGVTDDIMAALSKLDDLRVISRTSVLQYRETTKPVRQIAQELGVGTLLEGTVRRAGDRVRITVQLIDARTDDHLWSEQYDRELTDVFAIQTEIAEAIAGRLHADLAAEERRRIEAGQTHDPEAYLLVLKSRERRRSAFADMDSFEEKMRAAIDLLHQAIARDPRYAGAYAELAGTYALLSNVTGGSWADSSKAAALRAIELDPRLGTAHRALGDAHREAGRWTDATASYRRAIELDPNNLSSIATLRQLLFASGRFHESLRLALKIVPLEPTSFFPYVWVGITYQSLEMLDEAEAWFARAIELAPDRAAGYANMALFRLMRGDTLGARTALDRALEVGPGELESIRTQERFARVLRNWEEVRSAVEREHAVAGNWEELAVYLGYAYERLGEGDRAAELYRTAERDTRRRMDERENPFLPYTLAALSAVRGEEDAAIGWLEEAYDRGYRFRWSLSVDPEFESVRDDPRFQQLLERMEADLARMRERVQREGLVRSP